MPSFTTGTGSTSSALQSWAAQRRSERAAKNIQQSSEAGAKAGLTGEYEPREAMFGFIGRDTVEAYNDSMQSAYISKLDADNTNRISEIAISNPDNLQGFDAAVDGMLGGLAKEVDPEVRDLILSSAQETANRQRLRVQSAEMDRNNAAAAADRSDASNTYYMESGRLARNGDIEGSAENLIKFEAVQDARLAAGEIDVEQRNELVRNAERESVEQTNLGGLDRQSTEDAQAWIDEQRSQVPVGFTADEWDSHMDSAQADLNRRLSRERAVQAETEAENALRVNEYTRAALMGEDISSGESTIVHAIDPEAAARADQVSQFAVMSASDRANLLEQTSLIESDDPLGVALLRESNNLVNAQAEKDPYALAVSQGIVNEVPLDLTDPNTLALRDRQAEMISEHYGVPSKPLTDGEAESLAAQIPNMTVEEQISLINNIQSSGAVEVFEQVAGKDQLTFATAGAIGEFSVMNQILRGQEMLNLGTASKPSQSDYLDDFNGYVGAVYEGVNRQAMLESTLAYYAARGNTMYDAGEFRRALEAVTGGVDEVNGAMVELPRGVDRRDFDKYLDRFSPEAVENFGGVLGMNNEQAADAIQRGTPVSVGSNKYEIDFNGLPLKRPDGTNFVLSYDPAFVAAPSYGRGR